MDGAKSAPCEEWIWFGNPPKVTYYPGNRSRTIISNSINYPTRVWRGKTPVGSVSQNPGDPSPEKSNALTVLSWGRRHNSDPTPGAFPQSARSPLLEGDSRTSSQVYWGWSARWLEGVPVEFRPYLFFSVSEFRKKVIMAFKMRFFREFSIQNSGIPDFFPEIYFWSHCL